MCQAELCAGCARAPPAWRWSSGSHEPPKEEGTIQVHPWSFLTPTSFVSPPGLLSPVAQLSPANPDLRMRWGGPSCKASPASRLLRQAPQSQRGSPALHGLVLLWASL